MSNPIRRVRSTSWALLVAATCTMTLTAGACSPEVVYVVKRGGAIVLGTGVATGAKCGLEGGCRVFDDGTYEH